MPLPLVSLEGGLVADPEVRFSPQGKAWATARVACKDRKQENGQWVDGDVTFVSIVCFGREAEHLVDSTTKGDSITVTGRLQQQEWEDKEGNKRQSFRVICDTVGLSMRWNSYSKKDGSNKPTSSPAQQEPTWDSGPPF